MVKTTSREAIAKLARVTNIITTMSQIRGRTRYKGMTWSFLL